MEEIVSKKNKSLSCSQEILLKTMGALQKNIRIGEKDIGTLKLSRVAVSFCPYPVM